MLLLCVVAAWVATGCAGHAARTEEARRALDRGQPREALRLLNEELGVDSAKQQPADISGDTALLLLDRSMILQQLGQYELSQKDIIVADKQIDMLDLSRSTGDDIGKYLFSDDTGPYRAPPYEKLLINTFNMLNFLVLADLNGARIESRRLTVIQKYLKEHEEQGAFLMGPGSYLSGFVFEKSKRPQEAMRFYDEALQYGDYVTLREPIFRLAKDASYRSPRIKRILGQHDPRFTAPAPAPTPAADEPLPELKDGSEPSDDNEGPPAAEPESRRPLSSARMFHGIEVESEQNTEEEVPASTEPPPELLSGETGELLVVVAYGRVPAKYAKRLPIGLALTYASGSLSGGDAATANRLAAQGLVTWVNYPALGKSRGTWGLPEVYVDAEPMPLEGVVAIDLEAKKAWEENRGSMVAAAITRLVARMVAGEGVRQASGGGTIGLLLSLGTQATLSATDTPDTRSWSTLPARVVLARRHLRPGKHRVRMGVRGVFKDQNIEMRPGGWAVVNLTVLR